MLVLYHAFEIISFSDQIPLMIRRCDVNRLGLLLMEILAGKPVYVQCLRPALRHRELALELDPRFKELWNQIYPQTRIKELWNQMDPKMILKDTDIQRARELLYLILKCTSYHCTMEYALRELEETYSIMTRTITK